MDSSIYIGVFSPALTCRRKEFNDKLTLDGLNSLHRKLLREFSCLLVREYH
jgi:hypothetical protein